MDIIINGRAHQARHLDVRDGRVLLDGRIVDANLPLTISLAFNEEEERRTRAEAARASEEGAARLRELHETALRADAALARSESDMAAHHVRHVRRKIRKRFSLGFVRDHHGKAIPFGSYCEYRTRVEPGGSLGFLFGETVVLAWKREPSDEEILRATGHRPVAGRRP